jgi:DNA-binding NarL/FixJ family response regulator
MSTERRSDVERRRPITVVVVDGEPLMRAALAQMLTAGGLEVVGEADRGEDAIELVLDVRPDVVVMAIVLPGLSGVEVVKRLGLLAPASSVLVLTHSEQDVVVEAIIAGANGCISKTAPPEGILAAVRATAAGECVLSPLIAQELLNIIREHDTLSTPAPDPVASAIRAALTTRELDIFTLLASGETNHEIGLELSMSAFTVANHIKSILAKLHLENRIQAAVQAVRAGMS